jgi:hypothetical protein
MGGNKYLARSQTRKEMQGCTVEARGHKFWYWNFNGPLTTMTQKRNGFLRVFYTRIQHHLVPNFYLVQHSRRRKLQSGFFLSEHPLFL